MDGILDVVRATQGKYVRKYLHLLSALEQLGFIAIPAAVRENAYPSPKSELVASLREISQIPSTEAPRVEVIFVQPEPDPRCDSIGFEEFAAAVSQLPDALSQAFAKRLLKWRQAAGATSPWKSGPAGERAELH